MTKKEIVKRISDSTDELTQLKAKEIVQKTLDTIIDALTEEPHRIELRNFGVFEVRRRKPRVARNPKTNAKVQVPAKNVVTFKPGKEMEELIQKINAKALAEFLAGKDSAINAFKGPVMKAAKGRADPKQVDATLRRLLAGQQTGR